MMETLKRVLMILLPIVAISFACYTSEKPRTPNWQYATSTSIRLGIRDKDGTSEKYEAEFIVKKDGGQKFTAKKVVDGDKWGFVMFPTDFNTDGEVGTYSWTCDVGGKTIISGKFEFRSNQAKFVHQ